MKRKRFTEEQIIAVLREHGAGAKTADHARKHGVSEATLYDWKAKYGGLEVSEAKQLRAIEDENRKLKKLLAESMLDTVALKELLSKNGRALLKTIASAGAGGDEVDFRKIGHITVVDSRDELVSQKTADVGNARSSLKPACIERASDSRFGNCFFHHQFEQLQMVLLWAVPGLFGGFGCP